MRRIGFEALLHPTGKGRHGARSLQFHGREQRQLEKVKVSKSTELARVGGPGERLAGATVLLVDDHADLSDNLCEILQAEGARVIAAPNAAAALELSDRSDLVALVDINLPDSTGLELLPKLKKGAGRIVEVVLMTGHASVEDAIMALQMGAYDFVVKPFDLEHLIMSVSRAARQVRSAREANQLHMALSDSEASLRALVDAVQAMLLELDASGKIIRSNRAVSSSLGLGLGTVLGKNLFDDLVTPEDRDNIRAHFERVMQGSMTEPHVQARLLAPGRHDVDACWVHWNFARVTLERSAPRIYASGIDVTELRALERQKRVHEKLAAVGTLSAGLAHEIRNPLNAMSLQMQVMSRRIAKQGAGHEVQGPMDVIYSEIGRLSHLVDDFLRFARPSDLNAAPTDLVALVAQVVGFQQVEAKERGLSLHCVTEPSSLELLADGEKLRQVLVNLLGNALDASDPGQSVRVLVFAREQRAVVEVQDQGKGIPEAELSRIFEPFFSTKANGTGLGMAICHRLIDLHGGEILVESQAGHGTCVRLELPYPDANA